MECSIAVPELFSSALRRRHVNKKTFLVGIIDVVQLNHCNWKYYSLNGSLTPHKWSLQSFISLWPQRCWWMTGLRPSSIRSCGGWWLRRCQTQSGPKQRLSHPVRPHSPGSDPTNAVSLIQKFLTATVSFHAESTVWFHLKSPSVLCGSDQEGISDAVRALGREHGRRLRWRGRETLIREKKSLS